MATSSFDQSPREREMSPRGDQLGPRGEQLVARSLSPRISARTGSDGTIGERDEKKVIMEVYWKYFGTFL